MALSPSRTRFANPWALLCSAVLACGGCENLGARKFDNPVAGPPPRRVRADAPEGPKLAQASDRPEASDTPGETEPIQKAGYSRGDSSTPASPGGEVAVVVNGQPIFIDDILEALPPEGVEQLALVRRKSTPEEFEKYRRKVAMMSVRPLIERTVLVQALHSVDKPDKIKQLGVVLDKYFEDHLQRMMSQMGVSTKGELQVKLREQGTSLKGLRDAFHTDQMARYYLGQKAPDPKKPDRPQLLAWYEAHLEEYTYESQVRWQQIILAHQRYGGEAGARKLAGEISQRLLDGEDFGKLAREYSTGSTAAEGGAWDWTREGSLASKDVEKHLFTLPVGGVSPPILRKDSVELVRVLERKDGGRQSFESVQNEIEEKIMQEARQKAVTDLIKQLVEQAEVTVLLKQ